MTRPPENIRALESTDGLPPQGYSDTEKAYQRILDLYQRATVYLRGKFSTYEADGDLKTSVRACYPHVKVSSATFSRADTRM